ncbi:hypothetical protein DL765_008232 [Monosporascus sp. GIB2]|nr:hypothetical protein DL765_008232 [Monosporascus sp. GIB2]
MEKSRSLPELGDVIQAQSNAIYDWLRANDFPQPSWSREASLRTPPYPSAIEERRAELLEALDELRALVLGPNSYLFFASFISPVWISVFNVLYRYRIAQHVPDDGAISYADLSERCGLTESDTRLIVRAARSLRIFEESPAGFVSHNIASASLATTLVHDSVGFATEEYVPAAMRFAEALQRFPGSDKASESAIAIANGSVGERDIFSAISHDAARVERFANAMSWVTTVPETSSSHFVDNVPWAAAGNPTMKGSPKVVVDVGGSRGDLCEALLRKYPDIEKAIVEDLPAVTKSNLERPPSDVANRMEYRAYDFFTKQVVRNADVYIFRTVLHDWPDSYAIQILQNQVPAMKPRARILINDICIDAQQATNSINMQAKCAHDLMVKMGLNAKERTRGEWEVLLKSADARFRIESIITPPYSVHSIIEVVWQGGA